MRDPSSGVEGKVALITGSTYGIGAAVARRLAESGAAVVINGRNPDPAQVLLSELRSRDLLVHFEQADLSDWLQVERLVGNVLERFDHIDILVAAGRGRDGQRGGLFHQMDPLQFEAMVGRLVLTKLYPIRAVVGHMMERQSGHIVTFASEGGRYPTPGQTSAALNSGGLVMFIKTLAKELARYRVRVNAVSLTLVRDTPSWERFEADRAAGDERVMVRNFAKVVERAPFGLAGPDDVANIVRFLVSEESKFITGQTFSATGGLVFP